jgi:hypothetical protein
MIVTQSLKDALIEAAAVEYNKAIANLDWAKALVIGQPLGNAPQTKVDSYAGLYYYSSASGKTKGHYIILQADGSASCSCPGNLVRGRCWASTKVKNGSGWDGAWRGSVKEFYRLRAQALLNPQA